MPNAIIADTSCLIILANIDELDLLRKVFGTIVTTGDVAQEFGEPLPIWIEIASVTDLYRQQLLEMQIDKGESSAIALALETPNSTVILDDFKARKIAERLGLRFTGTLGVMVKAKLQGEIPSIKPLLEKMHGTNFHLSPELEEMVLQQANEN